MHFVEGSVFSKVDVPVQLECVLPTNRGPTVWSATHFMSGAIRTAILICE